MKLTKLSSTGNFSKLYTKGCIVYFSYETPIAIWINGKLYVSFNDWGSTTGKHINRAKREYPVHVQIPHSELLSIIELEIG